MALLRKLFYRKPPDGLLEICDRVYVFDCCFSTDGLEEEDYKVYMVGIVGQLRDQFPDASFMVFNFREGERQSQISEILSEYDMTVMDYPRHYEGCPLLPMEMIHHFLRSSESWLSLGQQNLLLMHCERGGWPVLAFMLAGLLLYRKQYTGELKTLEMVSRQAPTELLQFLSPLNPQPSQLRYLQYISRRNVGLEWPPLDRALTLDCIMLRMIPNFDGEGGCRPIFRIYGQDPFIATDRTPKVLFSTPKKSKSVRLYKQADCELIKIDIHCHIQGDVVLECISLDDDLEREEMIFRVMFNTAFIRSNILMLNRDEIDILWNAKDLFPKDFRAEVILSEMDSTSSLITVDLGDGEEKEGLPMEAFTKVHEIFNHVDWLDSKGDAAHRILRQMTATRALQEQLDAVSPLSMTIVSMKQEEISDTLKEEMKSDTVRSSLHSDQKKEIACILKPSLDDELFKEKVQPQELTVGQEPSPDASLTKEELVTKEELGELKPSSDPDLMTQTVNLQELLVSFQHPGQTKIICQRIQPSLSNPVSYSNSLQGSPFPMSRYHSAPPALGITALLHDHTAYGSVDVIRPMKRPSRSPSLSVICETRLHEPAIPNSAVSPEPSLSSAIKTAVMDSPRQQQYQIASESLSSVEHAHPICAPPLHPAISSAIGGGSSPISPPSPPYSCPGETLLFSTNLDRTRSPQTLPLPSGFVTENNLSLTPLIPSLCAPSFGSSAPPSPPTLPVFASSTPYLAVSPAFASSAPNLALPSLGMASSGASHSPPPPFLNPPAYASLAFSPNCPLPTCALSTPPPPPSTFVSSTALPPPPSPPSMFVSSTAPPPPPPPPMFVLSTAPPPPSMFVSATDPPPPSMFVSATAPPPPPPPPSMFVSSTAPPPTPPSMFVSSTAPPPTPPSMFVSSTAPPSPPPSVFVSSTAPPPSPPSMFVSSTAPPPPPRSMFVSSTAPPPPPSMFVSSTAPPPFPPSLSASSAVFPSTLTFASLTAPPPPLLPPPPSGMVASSNPPPPPPPAPPSPSPSPSPSPMVASSNPPPPPLTPPNNPSLFSAPPLTKKSAVPSTPPPPPPPIQSGVPGPATPLTPPPPPPLLFGSKAHGGPPSGSPPNAPPIPPPAPGGLLGKGTGNIGVPPPAAGAAPPPLGPPFGFKGRGMKSPAATKRNTLKPLHWIKVTRAMQGSLWAESQRNDEASKAPEFDMVELERLFSAAPSSDLSKKNEKSNQRSARGPKSEKVHLIDLKRANNCEIMLSKVKMPLPDLMSTLLALDDTVLDVDQVENLIKYCPNKDEVELLKGYNGDKENLGRCEQFFLELMKVPRVESKLRVFSFKIQFTSQVSDLRNSLNIVNSTADEIRSSVKLKRIMQTILSLGNALNQGTARGSAIGFRLDSLLKLTDTRARNNKMTLMHYLCKVLSEKLPELLDFPKDLFSLEAATKIQLKSLAEEMQAINKGLEKVEQELTASENDGRISLTFHKMLRDFLVVAEAEVRSLTSLYSGVGRNADALAIYFGEDPARCPFEQVVSTLFNFVRMFVRAHEENCKQLEIEKKKAQKEAENEKMKISTPKKESEPLLRSPLRSDSIK